MPTLSFPIGLAGIFRTLGPIIDKAIDDPFWDAQIILGPPRPLDDPKAYQNSIPANIPENLIGRCKVKQTYTLDELASELRQADVVVADKGRAAIVNDMELGPKPFWCAVFDSDHSVLPSHRFHDADMAVWPSQHYVEWAIRAHQTEYYNDVFKAQKAESRPEVEVSGSKFHVNFIRDLNNESSAPRVGTRAHFENTSCYAGFVRTEILQHCSPVETRRDWGIDIDRPVVLYIPDGYLMHRQSPYVTSWYRNVWNVNNRLERLVRALIFRRTMQGFQQALTEKDSYTKMMQEIRIFCDRNRAQLVMMPRRRKDWWRSRGFRQDELSVADHVISENVYYPQVMPRAAQMADLVVCSYQSASLLDAVAAGTSYITVGLPSCAWTLDNQAYNREFDLDKKSNSPGATWYIESEDFIGSFGKKSLSDFKIDSAVLEQLRSKFIGAVDGRCSQRILQELRNCLDS